MKNLFEIGLNEGGFFVFPVTSPPKYAKAAGDEVDLQQASDLRDSLNRSVQTWIADLGEHEPKVLLEAIAAHQDWQWMLALIADLMWKEYLSTPGATPQGTMYQNYLALSSIIQCWA